MVQVKDLTELTLKDLWKGVKSDESWWGELKEETLSLVKCFLESSMEAEITDMLSCGKYQRVEARRGYRNGYRKRSLLTAYGLLEKIKVPRDRGGAYQPSMITEYGRHEREVDRLLRETFLAGVSTRRVGEVLSPILQVRISPQTVSRVVASLDGEVRRYHCREIKDDYRYLLLDGITLKVKSSLGAKKRLVLCAYGITPSGKRELISFRIASAESEAQWEAFLGDLYRRGLTGEKLLLVITDGCAGLHRALDTVYPYIPRQRCWAHKLRNVASRLPRRIQKDCLKEAREIYQATTRRQARKLFYEWRNHWNALAPRAVDCLEDEFDELLSFLDCPRAHWRKIRTTNAIERSFREVRRRTRTISCFENSNSVERIIYGVVNHLNESWKEKPLKEFTHNT
jgi:putative transposase